MIQENLKFNILCVSDLEKGKAFIESLLPKNSVLNLKAADTVRSALHTVKSEKIDICIINSPLKDGCAIELSEKIGSSGEAAVLLFVKSDLYGEAVRRTENLGVFTVEKPNSEKLIRQALNLVFSVKRREKANTDKITSLEAKLDEIKIVNRAKLVLMQYLKMDETKAHRYIEKQAMDRRITRREVAEIIISTYEY